MAVDVPIWSWLAGIVVALVLAALIARERARLLRVQDQLAAARDEAEAGMRARSQFLANMSHEIRTPLNGILGLAALLQEADLPPTEAHYVRTIADSGSHLLHLLNDVLDFSRLEAGGIQLETTAFDLRGIVRDAIDMLAGQAAAKGIALTWDAAADVPRRAGGDPRRLRQVLLNLIGNAIKFTRAGSVHVAIERLGLDEGDERIGFSVTDTGIGIPQGAQARLFGQFAQMDGSIARRFGGSGLGLAISQRLVERMGGSISVDSTPGAGSSFRFSVKLRARRASDFDHSLTSPPVVAPPPPQARAHCRILVAEDNATNRLVATRTLERMGHEVHAVQDGEMAVAAVQAGDYDLVLMDVMMPVMDGLAATAAIRALPGPVGRLPIVGLTAASSHADELACLTAGMDHFASKPISAERLAAVIARVVPAISPGRTGGANPSARENRGFDAALLDTTARDIGRDATEEMVRQFIASADAQMAAITGEARAGSAAGVASRAHLLSNAARNVGLLRVGQAAGELRSMAGNAPAEALRHASESLASLLASGIDDLREWRPSGVR